MKKFFLLLLLMVAIQANAVSLQEKNEKQPQTQWTLNSRAWTTNYFTHLIGSVANILIDKTFKGNPADSMWVERFVPNPELVFPVGMGKSGFDNNDIYGPYHYAFGNPFKHIGDYSFGLEASYRPSFIGIYAGAYFKSQEIVFKEDDNNLRAFYVQPRFGLVLSGKSSSLEAGVFYDKVTGSGGTAADTDRNRLKGGWGLDFALSSVSRKGKSMTAIQFSMPLHNFLNNNYPGQQGVRRRVGYIMLTHRIGL
jgi:hypothetical protein